MTPVSKSLVQLNTAVILLGGTTLFAKLVSLPAHTITFYRAAFGFFSLLVFILMTGTRSRLADSREVALMTAAGLLMGLHWVSFFHAIQVSSVAVGIVSMYTYPVITALLEPLTAGRLPRAENLICSLMVFSGILLIIPDYNTTNPVTSGTLWGILSALLFSMRNILLRRKLSHIPGSVAMGYQLVVICVLLAPFSNPAVALSADNRLVLLLVLGIVFTALPHALIVSSLRNLTATTFSLIACLHPLYSIFLAMVLLSEFPTARMIGGGLIILAVAVYEAARVGMKPR